MAARRKNHKPYTGELARPIRHIPFKPPLTLGLLAKASGDAEAIDHAFKAEIARVRDAYSAAMTKKLPALFAHYEVAPGDFEDLVYALALAHVPGFQMANAPPGAKKKWTPFDTALLRFNIECVQTERDGRTFADAARRVAKSGLWSRLLSDASSNPGETLRRRALKADERLVAMLRSAYHYVCEVESPDNPPEAVAFVREYMNEH